MSRFLGRDVEGLFGEVRELNGFSSSAVYPCDYRVVVEVASRLATRVWLRDSANDGRRSEKRFESRNQMLSTPAAVPHRHSQRGQTLASGANPFTNRGVDIINMALQLATERSLREAGTISGLERDT